MDRTIEDCEAQAGDGYCFEDLAVLGELAPLTADEWTELLGFIDA